MSKYTFQWTDELVVEFTTWSLRDSPTFQGRYSDLEQFKQSKEQKECEWEIAAFSVVKGDITLVLPKMEGLFTNGFDSWTEEHLLNEKEVSIHSVKRLSDGEVFFVGQEVNYGKIEGFLVAWAGMEVHFTNGCGATFRSIEKLPPSTPQPEQPKRIQVAGIQQMNKYYPHSKPFENWFKFLIMNEDISPEKYPAIKSAIEAVLNDDVVSVKELGKQLSERYFVSIDGKRLYPEEQLREAEEKAFNAAREETNYPYQKIKFYTFQDYIDYLNSKKA